MIYTIGDSHSLFSFKNIPGVITCHIGPVTLKRVGYEEDILLSDSIKNIQINNEDILIFCFGEIDIRCYVKPNLERKSKETAKSLLEKWVNRYLTQLEKLCVPSGVKKYVMSVPPPASFEKAGGSPTYPVSGTNEERSEYTKIINDIFSATCPTKNLGFLDIYSKYKDENGMLIYNESDGTVHIANTKYVYEILIQSGILQ